MRLNESTPTVLLRETKITEFKCYAIQYKHAWFSAIPYWDNDNKKNTSNHNGLLNKKLAHTSKQNELWTHT